MTNTNCSFLTVVALGDKDHPDLPLDVGLWGYKMKEHDNILQELFVNFRVHDKCSLYYDKKYVPIKLTPLHQASRIFAYMAAIGGGLITVTFLPIICISFRKDFLDTISFVVIFLFVFQACSLLLFWSDFCTNLDDVQTACTFSVGAIESQIAVVLWFVVFIMLYYTTAARKPTPKITRERSVRNISKAARRISHLRVFSSPRPQRQETVPPQPANVTAAPTPAKTYKKYYFEESSGDKSSAERSVASKHVADFPSRRNLEMEDRLSELDIDI